MKDRFRLYFEDLIIPKDFDGTSRLREYYTNTTTLSIFTEKRIKFRKRAEMKVITKEEFFYIVYLRSGVVLDDNVDSHIF